MNKGLLRVAFCLMIFPAVQIHAQETRSATDAAPVKDAALTPAPAPPAPVSTMNSQVAMPEKPIFADSLMKNYQVETFQNVLKTAGLVNLNYKDLIESAKTGDVTSIHKLLDFHRTVDGVDGLNHAVTCLELIPLAGDKAYAAAVYRCSPKLRKLLIERLMLAQVRSKKTFLRQSLTNWAPATWAYLNGQTFQFEPQQAPAQPAAAQPAPVKPQGGPSLTPDSTQTRTRRQ